jgi:DNA repair protein RadC
VADGSENARTIRTLGAEGTERSGAHNFHNHPSGLSEPSAADELITRRLKEALALIDVRVLDHLIIAESIYSFAEHELL